jgi:hypothetical protein
MSQTPARASSIKDERERRRRIRESVKAYYDVEVATTNVQPTSSTTNFNNPQTTVSASATGTGRTQQSMDIDSTKFNPTHYTTALMRQSTLPKQLFATLSDLSIKNYKI